MPISLIRSNILRYVWRGDWTHLTLLFIFIVGLLLRTAPLHNFLWQLEGYDESRDMLVAKHIVEFGDWVWRGPYAAGSDGQLKNSPVYFYLISIFWFLTRSSLGVMVCWAFKSSLSILLAYKVGHRIWDNYTGIIFAALIAVHPELLFNAWHISQPYLLPLFVVGLLFQITRPQNPTLIGLTLAVLTIFLPLHIHYGSLLAVPAGLLWLSVQMHKYALRTRNFRGVFWVLVAIEFTILSWVCLTYTQKPFDQFYYILGSASPNVALTLSQFYQAIVLSLNNVWWSMPMVTSFGILIISLITPLRNKHKYIFWIVLLYVSQIFVAGIQRVPIASTYTLGTIPLQLLFLSLAMRELWKRNTSLGFICIAAIILMFVTTVRNEIILTTPRVSHYIQMKNIANKIYHDRNTISSNAQEFGIAVIAGSHLPYDLWGSSALWFHLEDFFATPLVDLTDFGANFFPRSTHPTHMYLLCDYRKQLLTAFNCTELFESKRSYLGNQPISLYSSDEFTLWKYEVIVGAKAIPQNVVYEQFLHNNQ